MKADPWMLLLQSVVLSAIFETTQLTFWTNKNAAEVTEYLEKQT